MITTSATYKELFEKGAIQEYKIIIDGVEYTGADIYGQPKISNRLFDKDTYTIGSFTVGILKVKLKVASSTIAQNAPVEYYYRYLDENETSEWVLKFTGKVSARTKQGEEVTLIEAKDAAANYDVFLDIYSDEIEEYPANTRTVTTLCAIHLGVTVDNIEDIYDGDIVEYPNELSIVEMLQNIAKLSGGNFIITEDNKLRIIVTRKTILIEEDEVDFSSLSPIPTTYQSGVLSNEIINGNFWDGTTNWTTNFQNFVSFVSTDNNILITEVKTPSVKSRIGQSVVGIKDNIYYLYGEIKPKYATIPTILQLYDINIDAIGITANEWNKLSGNVQIGTATWPLLRFIHSTLSPYIAGDKISYRNIMVFNLTALYGSGNEPTKEQMDELITSYIPNLNEFQYAKEFILSEPLKLNKEYTLSFSDYEPSDYYGVWLNDDYFVGYVENGELKFEVDFEVNSIIIKSLIGSEISNLKLAPILESYGVQNYEVNSLLNPISKVVMYYSDESAYQAGDDSGSILVSDCLWATQSTTDYVYSILNNYEYIPIKSTGVYLNPAVQVGDLIEIDGVYQLVANVDWTFDGSCIANIETPQNNDSNMDDPYDRLVEQVFKRKVTLGNSYQGVTISRDKGIEMLYSPDGTEDNATGKFYADLERGIAMQYRNDTEEQWQDWLYFDKNEKVFKLALYATDGRVTELETTVDGISTTVKAVDDRVIIAESGITQNAQNINLKVDKNGVISAINLSPETATISANKIKLEGYTTVNNNFKVLLDGTVEGVNVNLSGKVTATTGKIGGFNINGNMLVYESPLFNYEYTFADRDRVGNIILGKIIATPLDYFLYDFNGDGNISFAEFTMLQSHLLGITPLSVTRKISSIIEIGTTSGEIKTTLKTQTGIIGDSFSMVADKLKGKIGDFENVLAKGTQVGTRVELWSGSWNSGTITLNDDISKYNYCYVVLDGYETYLIVPILSKDLIDNPNSNDGYFRGSGSYVTSSNQHIFTISATFNYTDSPTILTFGECWRLYHTPSSNHPTKTNHTVKRIIGVK